MFNGLGDSIWSGSKNQAAAWKWVKFLASPACQDIVGNAGVVFRAIPSGTDAAEAAFKAKGVDVSAFTQQVKDDPSFLFPLTDHGAAISQMMLPAMDGVMNYSADSLSDANDQVNSLFLFSE